MDPHNLARFRSAQEGVYTAARAELQAGRKRTHWMWFLFPQLRSLGRSETARFYGLASREEAAAYLADPILGPRLIELCKVLLGIERASAHDIFGSPDDLKLRSCVTLFASLPDAPPVFQHVLDRYYDGEGDGLTQALLG